MENILNPTDAFDPRYETYTVYQATTAYASPNGAHLRDSQITAISTDLDAVAVYICRVRGLPLVDETVDLETFAGNNPVAIIEKITFKTEAMLAEYMTAGNHADFIMIDYPFMHRKACELTKKELKHLQVPQIICKIVDNDADTLREKLQMTFRALKEIYYLTKNDDITRLSPIDKSPIYDMCRWLEKALTPKGFEALQDCIYNRHLVFFCDEREYRAHIKLMQEQLRMDEEFRNRLDSYD